MSDAMYELTNLNNEKKNVSRLNIESEGFYCNFFKIMYLKGKQKQVKINKKISDEY